jgi:phospholipid/cholesterol/gamma-HCH transport system permease protein
MASFLNVVGRRATEMIQYPVELATLLSSSLRAAVAESGYGELNSLELIQRQVYFTAIQAVPLVLITSISIGALIFIAAITMLPGFGVAHLVGAAAVFLLLRELSPIFIAVIVISRSGTAIATELGNMKINGEISLLESHGININFFLIFPRIAGLVISMILLHIFFGLFSIAGGYTFSRSADGASEYPLYKFLDEMSLSYISVSLLKVVSFALIISTICCYHGLEPEHSSTEVPQSATKAVVYSLALCILANSFMSIYL